MCCFCFWCSIAFADPVSADTYKKFDSGKIKSDGVTIQYTSYIKGKNNIYMKLSYKNIVLGKIYLVKEKTRVKMTCKILGEKTQYSSFKHYGLSLKSM